LNLGLHTCKAGALPGGRLDNLKNSVTSVCK
jgi:hypothetical protein